ncbi:hypothetical protein PCA10_07230 [Metapseudomonas resinovorans NBRC 106553]|uniref:Uncharacterized protein n=1 Tax=Metapseudomonas resinovorans NBRC 106553 TaxID=1245471 RepID=S6AFD5_METRE|nr:hypothetical protein PCA10_07230 [Pseudomonas resinovorans NBRC 106553]
MRRFRQRPAFDRDKRRPGEGRGSAGHDRAAAGAFGPVENDLGNFGSSRASEPTRNRVEFQVISVPRIAF